MAETAVEDGRIALGSFEWRPTRAAIEAYAVAVGDASEGSPFAFPVAALALPGFRAALAALVPPGFVPVHEAQSLARFGPIAADALYRICAQAQRRAAPDRLIVDWSIEDEAGVECVAAQTKIRLFAAEFPA